MRSVKEGVSESEITWLETELLSFLKVIFNRKQKSD